MSLLVYIDTMNNQGSNLVHDTTVKTFVENDLGVSIHNNDSTQGVFLSSGNVINKDGARQERDWRLVCLVLKRPTHTKNIAFFVFNGKT